MSGFVLVAGFFFLNKQRERHNFYVGGVSGGHQVLRYGAGA